MINRNTSVIVIVTYNGIDYIDACLKSCGENQIIVVDNASTDTTVSFVKENYPNVQLFEQPENLGFGQANNIGIAHALRHGAEHILLLNQDAYLIDNCLNELIQFQKLNTNYGIISPIHLQSNRKLLDRNFAEYVSKKNNSDFYDDFVLGNPIQDIYEVPFINAATWLISKKCAETVGGFDPIFFHYGEDNNYCQRVKYHGFKIGVLTKNFIIHDREDRAEIKLLKYSSAYFKEQEKRFKIKFANINDDKALIYCNTRLKALKANAINNLIKFDFKNFKMAKTEYHLLKSIKTEIEGSFKKNKAKGTHYLNV